MKDQHAGRSLDLDSVRRFAVETAEGAGALLRKQAVRGFETHAKGRRGDVVTSLDLEIERHIIDQIAARFPGHGIIAEESGSLPGETPWLWLADPLDGTNNFLIGLPAYVIGLTLCYDGRPLLGVVHDPVGDQTWSAVLNRGFEGPAGRRPPVTGRRPILAWTQGYEVGQSDLTASALKFLLDRESTRLLQLWAPLLCWAMLARGDIDGPRWPERSFAESARVRGTTA